MLDRKRNEVVIPFNKSFMTMRDMGRCVSTLETIIERWHVYEEKRVAQEAATGVVENYDEITDEFFWDVHQQIHQFSTHRLEEKKEKGND